MFNILTKDDNDLIKLKIFEEVNNKYKKYKDIDDKDIQIIEEVKKYITSIYEYKEIINVHNIYLFIFNLILKFETIEPNNPIKIKLSFGLNTLYINVKK